MMKKTMKLFKNQRLVKDDFIFKLGGFGLVKAVLNITRNVLVIPRIFKSYFARVTLLRSRSSKKKIF